MVENLHQLLKLPTKYWQFHYPNARCQTPNTAIPWLLCIVAFTVSWTFILGAQDIRHWIRKKLNPIPISARKQRTSKAISILGSLVLHLALTLATAQIIRGPPNPGSGLERPSLATATSAWMLRPMPGVVVSVTSLMSPSTYSTNAMEIQVVELLYSLGGGYFIFDMYTTAERTRKAIKGPVKSMVVTATTTTGIRPTATASPTSSTNPTNAPKSGLQVSQDRTCGGAKQQTCLGSTWGDCCSAFGYCGRDTEYCTGACQPGFGTCKSTQKQKRISITTDGSCGSGSGTNASCSGSRWGDCCSAFSFCGSNETYCGTGCQSQYGTCSDKSANPASAPLSEAEQSALKLLSTMRSAIIIAILVWTLSVALVVAAAYVRCNGPATLTKSVPAFKVWCVVLSLGRFIAVLIIWDVVLRLDGEAFCLGEKTVRGITVLWTFAPAVDHVWRAIL